MHTYSSSTREGYLFTEQFDRIGGESGEPIATTVGTIAIGSENRHRIVLAILRAPTEVRLIDWFFWFASKLTRLKNDSKKIKIFEKKAAYTSASFVL